MADARVALARCKDYADHGALSDAVSACFAPFGGVGGVVHRGQRVLLKPNLLAASPPESGVDTHPALVRAVAELALRAGGSVAIGDSPAFAPLDRVCEASGMARVARDLQVPIVAFNQPVWVPSRCPGAPARGFTVDRAVLEADVVINLPKLKAHRQLGFTAGIKNLYGCMPGKRKAWFHASKHGDHTFAAFLAAFAATVAPAFTLVDAIVAMHRDGPKGGDLLPMGLLAASTDVFALDTLLSCLIAVPEPSNLLVNAARRLGLGTTDPARIVAVGDEPPPLPPPGFRHPMLVGTGFSLSRVARSAWRSFLISRLGLPERT